MQKCPNCGQEAARTEDWACQWCGYPLLSESYKKVPKTYKELKEEKLSKQKLLLREEIRVSPLPNHDTLPPTHIPEPEPELVPPAIGVTIKKLYSAYKADKVAADVKFTGKVLKLKGVVDKIVVADIYDIHFIILTSADEKEGRVVLCGFDKEHEPELNRLTIGQTVTVQGKCDGYKIHILMKDCVLVC